MKFFCTILTVQLSSGDRVNLYKLLNPLIHCLPFRRWCIFFFFIMGPFGRFEISRWMHSENLILYLYFEYHDIRSRDTGSDSLATLVIVCSIQVISVGVGGIAHLE